MESHDEYIQVITENLELIKEEWFFKLDPRYTRILEHLIKKHANKYLSKIASNYSNFFETNKEYLRILCEMNDNYGKPTKFKFVNFKYCSTSNMRYIYHALIIFEHIVKNLLNDIDFIEVGGGYGGLAFFIHKLSPLFGIKINSYTIFDIKEASELQKKYLEAHGINIQTLQLDNFNDSGLSTGSFLISNHCYSEMTRDLRIGYTKKVFNPYVSYGFFVWNSIPLYNFIENKKLTKVVENPHIKPGNFYVHISPEN
jgi:hypothetical protein